MCRDVKEPCAGQRRAFTVAFHRGTPVRGNSVPIKPWWRCFQWARLNLSPYCLLRPNHAISRPLEQARAPSGLKKLCNVEHKWRNGLLQPHRRAARVSRELRGVSS